ncbi:transposase family protein, partial [uncultured Gemella sp.]|uniref:transposase family protein n=1 Tax=uncultured Gemella sp. TaxID=254352 RepID=UPI0028D7C7C8
MCNYSKSLKTTLQITDRNIKILDKTEEIEINGCIHLVYYGVLEASSSSCPHCGKCEITNNGYRKVKVKIPLIFDKSAILYLNKQRFICKDCHKSLTAGTTEVRKHSNTSKILRASIIKRLSKENTSKEIAESCTVSTNTVLRIQCDLAKSLERPKSLPYYMCFDEVSS